MVRTVVALLLAVLVAGCGPSDGAPDSTDETRDDTSACDEVRAGIDAFNQGDYVETQVHFRRALPLASDAADDDSSRRASDLLEAVKYYADLDPDDYPESARSSADFQKYKRITLGQCVPVEQPGDEPGTEV